MWKPKAPPTMRRMPTRMPPAIRKRLSIGITSVSGCDRGRLGARAAGSCGSVTVPCPVLLQAGTVGAYVFVGRAHHGLAEAGGEARAGGRTLARLVALLEGGYQGQLVLDLLEVLVQHRVQALGRQEVREMHQHQEFGFDLVLRFAGLEPAQEGVATGVGQVIELLAGARLAWDRARYHQPLFSEFGERRVDGAEARQEAVAEGALEELLEVVARGVAVSQRPQAQVFDVHRGSLPEKYEASARAHPISG